MIVSGNQIVRLNYIVDNAATALPIRLRFVACLIGTSSQTSVPAENDECKYSNEVLEGI